MISVVCLSRNRPMQLHAYLESLQWACDDIKRVTVAYRADPGFDYSMVMEAFPAVEFIDDGGNQPKAYREAIEAVTTRHTLLGVDDVVFVRQFTEPRNMAPVHSLRLGEIDPVADAQYRGDVSASIYPTQFLRAVIMEWPELWDMRINALEPRFNELVSAQSYSRTAQRCAVNFAVNKVAPDSPCDVMGNEATTVEALMSQYNDGLRLDWQGIGEQVRNRDPHRPHVGLAYWRLK